MSSPGPSSALRPQRRGSTVVVSLKQGVDPRLCSRDLSRYALSKAFLVIKKENLGEVRGKAENLAAGSTVAQKAHLARGPSLRRLQNVWAARALAPPDLAAPWFHSAGTGLEKLWKDFLGEQFANPMRGLCP